MDEQKSEQPEDKKSPPDLLGGLGLTLDLNECVDEFFERAKVLPFIPRPKGE